MNFINRVINELEAPQDFEKEIIDLLFKKSNENNILREKDIAVRYNGTTSMYYMWNPIQHKHEPIFGVRELLRNSQIDITSLQNHISNMITLNINLGSIVTETDPTGQPLIRL